MKIGTHNGLFHADDAFALATLQLAGVVDEVVRTRDAEVLASCDLRVDVGRKYDPAAGDFDHHQEGGAGERANGIKYASFGIIWKEYGAKVAGSPEVAAYIDERLVQFIDADDTGQTPFTSRMEGVALPLVSRSLNLFNPTWDDSPSDASYDAAFYRATRLAMELLKQEVRTARAVMKASGLVSEALAAREKPAVLVLERYLPWQELVIDVAPGVLFCVYPRLDGTWSVQAVKKRLDSFENRRDLPNEWAGKVDGDLAAVTGVDDATFCHTGRFLAVAKSREGALKLAELALG